MPRTSLGAGTRCPLSGLRLLSCCVWRPKSIVLTQPAASLLPTRLPLPIARALLNPAWSALVIRPNDRLSDERRLEGMAKREANGAAGDARRHVGNSDASLS